MGKIDELRHMKRLFKKGFKEELRRSRREDIFTQIREVKKEGYITIDESEEWLDSVLFDVNPISGEKKLDIPEDIIHRLNYSNVSFDKANVKGIDFSRMYGVYINPQTVHKNDLRNTVLYGVTITGPLDDAYITGANFIGSKGALINPQTIYDKDLRRTIIGDVIVVNEFKDVKLNDDTMFFDTTTFITKEQYEELEEMKKVLIK